MTLKVRLAAMMTLLIVAVLALQFLLTAREQRDLAERIARLSEEVNLTAAQATTLAFDLAHEGPDVLLTELDAHDLPSFTGRTEVRLFRTGTENVSHLRRERVVGSEHDIDHQVWIDSVRTSDSARVRIDTTLAGGEIVVLAEFTHDSTYALREVLGERADRGDSARGPGEFQRIEVQEWRTSNTPATDRSFVFQLPLMLPQRDSLHVVELRYPLADLTEALADARRRSLLWMGSLLGVGALGAALMAIQFTSPIRKLERSFQRVEEGDLDVRVDVTRQDEIGKLTASFNHMVGRLRDTRTMEQRLQENERLAAMGRLAAGVAHEVRNPLNAIQLNLQQLHDKAAPVTGDPRRGDFDRYYATVTGEILRLEHLVGAFLDLSRSEAMSRGPVDLGRSVATAIALFEPDAEDRGVVLSATTAPDLVVDGDAGRLATVWNNLLSNALGAATGGGRIDVTVSPTSDPRGSGAEVVVHDDGEGMSPDELARVWDPFYSEKDGGTGLGLSIVRSVVERHGGTASIESAPGRGTTARVWLPIGPRQGEA